MSDQRHHAKRVHFDEWSRFAATPNCQDVPRTIIELHATPAAAIPDTAEEKRFLEDLARHANYYEIQRRVQGENLKRAKDWPGEF